MTVRDADHGKRDRIGVSRDQFFASTENMPSLPLRSILVGWAVAIYTAPVAAMLPIPALSWSSTVGDGKFVFVIVSDHTLEQELALAGAGQADNIRKIRNSYLLSGLYRNNTARELLWRVNKYYYPHDVIITSNGVNWIDPSWNCSDREEEVIHFFANGKRLRTWRVDDLVSASWELRREHGPYKTWFRWAKEHVLDEDRGTFAVVTDEGNRLVFDIRTGEMIEGRPLRTEETSGRIRVGIAIVLAMLLISAGLLVALRLRGHKHAGAKARDELR